MPEGTSTILSARTLTESHRRLDELVEPGMSVLDVGCGNGAITVGIARKVGPNGRVVGVDVNERLIREARDRFGNVDNLTFRVRDAYDLRFQAAFDITTAARVLQWLAHPADALDAVAKATVPGGKIIVLDYNHKKVNWTPDPPESVRRFYQAFLDWRVEAGMENALADRLLSMFGVVGLRDVAMTQQHEVTIRGDADFEQRISIWESVISSRGKQMVADGAISEPERESAEREYVLWARNEAQSQALYLLAVEGTK